MDKNKLCRFQIVDAGEGVDKPLGISQVTTESRPNNV